MIRSGVFSRISSKVRTSKKMGWSMPRLYGLAFGRIWYIVEGPSRNVSFDLFVELNSSPRPDGTKPVWLVASRMHSGIMGKDYPIEDIRMYWLAGM